MGLNYTLPLRIAQAVLTFLVLCLMSYVVDRFHPSEANFFLFCSVWSILALAYLIVAPARFPQAAHKFLILGVEALTMIFWFAGWVAFASLLGDIDCRRGRVCQVSKAAVVFGAFEWLLFVATTTMAALHCWKTRNDNSNKPYPAAVEVQPGV